MAQLETITRRLQEVRRDIDGMKRHYDEQTAKYNLTLPLWAVSEDYQNAVEELDFLEWFEGILKASDKTELDENKARELYIEYKF